MIWWYFYRMKSWNCKATGIACVPMRNIPSHHAGVARTAPARRRRDGHADASMQYRADTAARAGIAAMPLRNVLAIARTFATVGARPTLRAAEAAPIPERQSHPERPLPPPKGQQQMCRRSPDFEVPKDVNQI